MEEKIRTTVNSILFGRIVPASVQNRVSPNAILYVFYGVLSTLADWSIFYLAGAWFALGYIPSATMGFLFSSTMNFVSNKYLNFQNRSDKLAGQYGIHFLIGVSGLMIVYFLLFIFIDLLGVHRMPAKMLASVILAFYGYFAHKNITFRTARPAHISTE